MAEYAHELSEAQDLVARATDEALAGPEWALNMALCDCANAHHAVCDDIVRLLQRRLQSGTPKATLLALVLTETVVKNGPPAIHCQVGSRLFLSEVAALSDGSLGVDVQNHALLLIRQWADAFQGSELKAFQDVYRQLKMQGVAFPEVENDVPIFTPPSSTLPAAAAAASSGRGGAAPASPVRRTREQQLEKLHADLEVVQQKIKLLRELSTRGQTGEQLEDVLDFLRQCQPRMNTLIEGGIMGKIDERTLEECLNVNDNLMKTLEECGKNKMNDMMTFDSPPRANRTAGLSQGVAGLSLDEGRASGAAAAPRPVPFPRSTLTTMDDGTLYGMFCDDKVAGD
ncbi:gamma adaptin ear containing, arf binding protein [Phytophthora pseudosyringae]|uniref:Gamma adaptin ear containing, arf binding protein n=1 Tax=Phytophthora pseudosyringae TaxID=221518 RepID=A0A8T1WC78_9STRA|nr:gamma adaptin ear containing, arf binding protein [Phytophthora pseudosyringae]